jgi:hypothetical protein
MFLDFHLYNALWKTYGRSQTSSKGQGRHRRAHCGNCYDFQSVSTSSWGSQMALQVREATVVYVARRFEGNGHSAGCLLWSVLFGAFPRSDGCNLYIGQQ